MTGCRAYLQGRVIQHLLTLCDIYPATGGSESPPRAVGRGEEKGDKADGGELGGFSKRPCPDVILWAARVDHHLVCNIYKHTCCNLSTVPGLSSARSSNVILA